MLLFDMTKSRVAPKPYTNPDTLPAEVAATLAANAAEADECAARATAEENHRRACAAEELATIARDRARLAADTAEAEHRASVAAAVDREREWMADQSDAQWSAVAAARALRDQNELRAKSARAVAEGAAADHAAAAARARSTLDALRDAEDAVRQSAEGRRRNAERAVALASLAALARIGDAQMNSFGPALTVHVATCAIVRPGINPLAERGAETVRYAFELSAACAQLAWSHMGASSWRERRRLLDLAIEIAEHAVNVARAVE